MSAKTPVIILQDGAVDELMSVALVETMADVELLGIGIVNADCLARPTLEVTNKILQLMQRVDVPVTISTARAVNAFPWVYRQYSMMANLLPMLNVSTTRLPATAMTTEEMLVHLITENGHRGKPKVKILVLSPLTPLATALAVHPELKHGIGEVLWMGGALPPEGGNCGLPYGNVDPGLAPGANANAEWNAYWDPIATRAILAAGLNLTMFPLNATNLVMLTPEIVLKFAPQSAQYPLYALAGQLYSMVAFEAGYAFWDTVTAAYLDRPDLYTVTCLDLLNETSGPNEGNLYVSSAGYPVNVVTKVKVEQPATEKGVNSFYAYLFEQWKWLPDTGANGLH